MRVLIISNFYPPHSIGGYELACSEVVNWLVRQGTDVTVLTQRGAPSTTELHLSILRRFDVVLPQSEPKPVTFMGHLRQLLGDMRNYLTLVKFSRRWKPDLIVVFNPSGLGGLLLNWLHRPSTTPTVVHDISDEWLLGAYQNDAWFALPDLKVWGVRKRLLRTAVVAVGRLFLPEKARRLALDKSYFRSAYLKRRFLEEGYEDATAASVIHHGVRFSTNARNDSLTSPQIEKQGILFAARLCREKGLHILLQALRTLPPQSPPLRVTVAGKGSDAVYQAEVEHLLSQLPADIEVEFVGHVSWLEVQGLLRSHAIFAFPVVWDEPFSLTLLEAASAGIAIVATATGGTNEILSDERNCLIVERGNVGALAGAITRLLQTPSLCALLGAEASKSVKPFDLERILERIGQHLQNLRGFNLGRA